MNISKKTKKRFLITFWSLVILPIFFIAILFYLISSDIFGKLPSFEQLENPSNNLASEVISEDSKILGSFYYQNRSYVNYEDLSPNLVTTLITTEDVRFRSHSGIDARGTFRVLTKTILQGNRGSGGGSTITQQLAKNLYGRDTTTYKNKFDRMSNIVLIKLKEWVTAARLEKSYTKNEILVMYLNTVFFGNNSYGIKSAAKTYFNKTPGELNIEESAMLVGLVNAPSRYNPVRHYDVALEKRNRVLMQLLKYEKINKHQYDSLATRPIDLSNFKVQNHNQGLATYFREYLRTTMNKSHPKPGMFFTEQQYLDALQKWENDPLYGWVNKNRKPNGDSYSLYRDGLKIYTTINSKMQQYAEEAVDEHLGKTLQPDFYNDLKRRGNSRKKPFDPELTKKEIDNILTLAMKRTEQYRIMRNSGVSMDKIKKWFNTPRETKLFSWSGDIDTIISPMDSIRYYKHFLRAGMMAMEPGTGRVKAYIGGNDYKYFKFDAITSQKRQVGSTIKPFLYTLAMQENYSPCHLVPNVPQTFAVGDTTWAPKNAGSSRAGEMVSLQWGLAKSNNNISAWLVKQFTPQAVVDMAHRLGIESKIDAVPSIVYGVSDFSLFEMVGAYGTFVNKGVHTKPIFVTRIEDKNGNILASFEPEQKEAIDEQTAYLMIKLLQNVANRGTATRLRHTYDLRNEMGGKTGTTQNHADGWFMGVTPNLVGGVWVGAEDRSVHFSTITKGQGANMALPIWAIFLKKVYSDPTMTVKNTDTFRQPLNFDYELDCDDDSNEGDSSDDENLFGSN